MISFILIVSLLVTSAIAKGFQDRINFKGNFKSDWMVGAGKYAWNKRTWWTKYPLSFISNGWHFFDMIRVMSLCIAITLCTNLAIYWALVLYIIHGLIFEATYRTK